MTSVLMQELVTKKATLLRPIFLNSHASLRPRNFWRRGWDSNPRYPFEVHTLSRRADSTSSRTSPCRYIHSDNNPCRNSLGHAVMRVMAEGEGFEPPRNLLGP